MTLSQPTFRPFTALMLDTPGTASPRVDAADHAPCAEAGAPLPAGRLSGPVLPSLRRLCRALGFSTEATERAAAELRAVFESWGDRRAPAGWVSDITEDHSEIEFSVSVHGGRPELRLMIEAQGRGPTVASQYAAALRLTERIGRLPGVNLDRFRALERIFRAPAPQGRFGLWHSICFRPDEPKRYKAYFNPLLAGEAEAEGRVRAAMAALGLEAGGRLVLDRIRRDGDRDLPKYLALDLDEGAEARVKIYLFHRWADAAVLERAAGFGQEDQTGLATRMLATLAPDRRVLEGRPAATCYGFRGQAAEPAEVNLYLPVCGYAHDDAQVRDRVLAFLGGEGLDTRPYTRALRALAARPLAAGIGIHSYVAASVRRGGLRSTVYLSPELRRAHAPGSVL